MQINPEDRMPTIEELRAVEPAAAWDRLSPEQQRQIGLLAVELSVFGGLLGYENSYTQAGRDEINARGDDALSLFFDGTEPLWHVMFGWASSTHSAVNDNDYPSQRALQDSLNVGSPLPSNSRSVEASTAARPDAGYAPENAI
jgi:hypothetical protein